MGHSRPDGGVSGQAWGGHPARLWPLAAVAVAVVALATLGVLPRWPGLVHLVALPPLDLFTDVRVLLTDAASVPAFVVVLAVRVAVLAVLLGGLTRHRLRFAALLYLAALPVMVLIAAAGAVRRDPAGVVPDGPVSMRECAGNGNARRRPPGVHCTHDPGFPASYEAVLTS